MKLRNVLWVAIALIIPGNVLAYGNGSDGGTGMCKAMTFSEFNPVNTAEVAPRSDFSFFASAATNPKSIKVTIKDESVPVTVTPKRDGFEASGKLPDSLKGTFAKVMIQAKGANQCEHTGGWLLKVTK
jgi:hypothetical protein